MGDLAKKGMSATGKGMKDMGKGIGNVGGSMKQNPTFANLGHKMKLGGMLGKDKMEDANEVENKIKGDKELDQTIERIINQIFIDENRDIPLEAKNVLKDEDKIDFKFIE